ncbi:hypothetical protein B0I35DRAFT_212192 [Stachybotrys elegans]|uniref:Heterokaryon incompatibility domain-containing protein n=1 Tax=Stachybotrys elegans TaxID=80388 RepID=A0A8K0WTM6_9HYPO|nr:hypothetical protein B0I35DRAFT_212192 [Stachybotrys elegans]
MRLLDTHRLELMDVAGDNIPAYAILSHTWGQEEVTFQEMQYVTHKWSRAVSQTASAIKAKSGYIKIKRSAALAVEHGYDFIWIDTCCIDKSSSAELSEAINSMYQWYKKAAICYAHLEDVSQPYHAATGTEFRGSVFRFNCQNSRWFTRGWTLQELIAPEDVMFYDADWNFLGSKWGDEDVRASLAGITGIDVRVLEGLLSPADTSIATRMKWASQRQTTRVEDVAYSLMGLFDVNMPLLYGEGTKAFVRLQEEILKGSDDHTIFAWGTSQPPGSGEKLGGLLAESPAAFAKVSNYRPLPPAASRGSTAWAITNHGLRIHLYLQPVKVYGMHVFKDEYDAILECAKRRWDGSSESPAIRLRRLYGDQFARINPQIVKVTTPSYTQDAQSGSYEVIFVKQKPVYAVPEFVVSFNNIQQPRPARQPPVSLTGVWPERYWDAETATLRCTPSDANRIVGLFRFKNWAHNTSIDCAIGLKRSPAGIWDWWTLLRGAGNALPIDAAASANQFLERETASDEKDWGPMAWRRNADGLDRIAVQIRHIHLHGRVYLSVLAEAVMELDCAKEPVELFSPGLSLRIDETKSPLVSRLQNLLIDLTVPTSLENTFLAQEAPRFMRIRTIPLAPILSEFRSFKGDRIIQGASPEATKVLHACVEGEIDHLKDLAAGDALLESTTTEFFELRPLHWAIIYGHLPVVKRLVELGADLRCRTSQGWLPFHLAALFGRFAILDWLLHDIFRPWKQFIPGSGEADLLADQNNALSENVIHLAVVNMSMAYAEDYSALYHLLRRPLAKKAWSSANHFGETPFHRLAAVGQIHIQSDLSILELFANGFVGETGFDSQEAKHLDSKGRTILWHAVCGGSFEIIELLVNLDRQAVSKPDKHGMTPLHVACRKGDAKVAKLLLLAGADPNARTNAPGLTPAHYAAAFDQPMCLRLLLEHGGDVTRPTTIQGESFRPIHLALSGKYQQCVYVLKSVQIDMDWMCTHIVRRIQSENDLCPFELVEGNRTVTDLVGNSNSVPGHQRTILSIDVHCTQDEDGNPVHENKDNDSLTSTDDEQMHTATLNPREDGEMEDMLLSGQM